MAGTRPFEAQGDVTQPYIQCTLFSSLSHFVLAATDATILLETTPLNKECRGQIRTSHKSEGALPLNNKLGWNQIYVGASLSHLPTQGTPSLGLVPTNPWQWVRSPIPFSLTSKGSGSSPINHRSTNTAPEWGPITEEDCSIFIGPNNMQGWVGFNLLRKQPLGELHIGTRASHGFSEAAAFQPQSSPSVIRTYYSLILQDCGKNYITAHLWSSMLTQTIRLRS